MYPSNLGALPYADEATFGASSVVYDERLPVANSISAMTAMLTRDKIDQALTKMYVNDAEMGASGVFGGAFPVDLFLPGHAGACTGAVSAGTQVSIFLGRMMGAHNLGQTGSTVASATNAYTFVVAGGTFVKGCLIRIGVKGDGRGNGEWYPIASVTGTTIVLLKACAGTPASPDVVYASELIYPLETPPASYTSLRANLQTARQRYGAFGLFPTGFTWSGFNPGSGGGLPKISTMLGVSRWAKESASTYPTDIAVETHRPAPATNGSAFIAAVGSSTRVLYDIRNLEITHKFESKALPTYTTSNAGQVNGGYCVVKNQLEVAFDIDAEAAGTETMGDLFDGSAYVHAMFGINETHQSAIGLYLPKAEVISPRPVQGDRDGLANIHVVLRSLTGGTTTDVVSASAWRLGLG